MCVTAKLSKYDPYLTKQVAAMALSIFTALFGSLKDAEAQLQTEVLNSSGNVVVFEEAPKTAWIIGRIQKGDYFHLRRVLRRNKITTIALHSPGGSVYEALQMGAIINDQKLTTFIPKNAICASACSYIFFAGINRVVDGKLGVHQFFGTDEIAPMEQVQLTVSEIMGFLNEFGTPPFVYERMFENKEIYYFSRDEIEAINLLNPRDAGLSTTIFPALNEIFSNNFDQENLTEKVLTTNNNVLVAPSEAPPTVLQPNEPSMTPEEIRRAIQYELNRVGCTLGPVDGIIGARSFAALRAYRDATMNPKEVTQGDFLDYDIIQEIRGHQNNVCKEPPNLPAPNLSGNWSISLNCPYGAIKAIAKVQKTFSSSYGLFYRNGSGLYASGAMKQREFRASGTIKPATGSNIDFSISINQSGTIFTGSASDGCKFEGRKM